MSEETVPRGKPVFLKRIAKLLFWFAVWGTLLFVPAGRLDWTRGWICLGLALLGLAVNAVMVLRKNPELMAERWKKRPDTKPFDRVFMVLYVPTVLSMPVLAGLDAVRFGWAPLPWGTLWPGVLLQLLGIPPGAWAMATNPHLETTVRIQHNRGHKAITTGPYAIVRHPMYVGALLTWVGQPLTLGSAWACVPAGFAILLFIIRTALEDRTLQRELPGYDDYARRTRYRLVPGLW